MRSALGFAAREAVARSLPVEPMRVVSINVGSAESITHDKRSFQTGINKLPADGAVMITGGGVADDAVCNEEHHGGPDQAVYAYSQDDYDWWAGQLGEPLRPGTLGDNLTISAMPSDLNVGDRLVIGDVVLEATAPRIPCGTLAAQMQDPGFGLAFRRAERPGIYFRVLNEGLVAAGDAVTLVENPDPVVSVLDLFRFSYDLSPSEETMRRYLEAPLAHRTRDKIEKKLASD